MEETIRDMLIFNRRSNEALDMIRELENEFHSKAYILSNGESSMSTLEFDQLSRSTSTEIGTMLTKLREVGKDVEFRGKFRYDVVRRRQAQVRENRNASLQMLKAYLRKNKGYMRFCREVSALQKWMGDMIAIQEDAMKGATLKKLMNLYDKLKKTLSEKRTEIRRIRETATWLIKKNQYPTQVRKNMDELTQKWDNFVVKSAEMKGLLDARLDAVR